jgi:uncharacterized protein with HEPN domain
MRNHIIWRDQTRLLDILNHARKVLSYARGRTYEDLLNDEALQLIMRSLFTIVGEAAARISNGFKDEHPEIPWPRISGLRNRVVHEYEKINWERVWAILQEDIPELIRNIEPLVPKE